MMHRTLFITQFFPPATGGIERYLADLCSALPSESVTVVAPPHPDDKGFDGSFAARIIRKDLLRHRFGRPSWLWHLPWLLRTIRATGAARLVFGHYSGAATLGLLAKQLAGVPYVLTFHGLDFLSYRTTAIRRALLRYNTRSAEWVVANSEYTRGLLRDFGVPDGKIVVAHPAVDEPVVPNADDVRAFRVKYRIPENARIVLTVARLVKRKGHGFVVKALPNVLASQPHTLYLIVGDGPERESLERAVDNAGVRDNVRFTGNVPDSERNCAYAIASAFIMLPFETSRDVEGFGISYVEALNRSIPIIAPRSGGVADIIRDNENGVVVNSNTSDAIASSIISLLDNPDRARTMGETGKSFVREHFSTSNLSAIFKTLLANPAQRNEKPLVSVIIPAWNAASTLPQTLNRLVMQTWKALEIIVVDDGSHDDVRTVCNRFQGVTYLRQAHAGAPSARNRGFKASTGQYVLFCDADVHPHPRMVERMVTTLELNRDASYAYCSFRFGWRTFDLFDFNPDRLKRSNFISTVSLIRRDAFPGFDETLNRLQDWDLWLTMLERGHRGVWVPARLFNAHIGKGAISKKISRPPADAVRIIQRKHNLAGNR